MELPLFDLVAIETATNNFSIENKLGEGGFGPVYKVKNLLPINSVHSPCLDLTHTLAFTSDLFQNGIEVIMGVKVDSSIFLCLKIRGRR